MHNNDFQTTDNEQMTKKSLLPWIILILILLAIVIAAVIVFNKKIQKDKEESSKEPNNPVEQNQQVMIQSTDGNADEAIVADEEDSTMQDSTEDAAKDEAAEQTEGIVSEGNNIAEDSKSTDTVEKHYMGVTYYLPAYFEKYAVAEEGAKGITYYQKSAQYDLYDGALFSIFYYTDSEYENLPNYKIIGNDGGYTYVFYYPSDVRFDYENKAVAEEYMILSEDSNNIKAFVAGDNQESESASMADKEDAESTSSIADKSEYILPNSSMEYLQEADVKGLSENQLMLARNEIYARHGYIFNTQEIADYFAAKSWYNPSVASDQWTEDVLNDYEKANIELIIKVETAKGYR